MRRMLGFLAGVFVGQWLVVPSVTWAKLKAMAEGARLASQQLWR